MDDPSDTSRAMELLSREISDSIPETYRLVLDLAGYISLQKALDFIVLMLGEPKSRIGGFVTLGYCGFYPRHHPEWHDFECSIPEDLYERLYEYNVQRPYPSSEARDRDRFCGDRLFNLEDGIRISTDSLFRAIGQALNEAKHGEIN